MLGLYHSGPASLFTPLSFPSHATSLTPDVQQYKEIFSCEDLSENLLIFHAWLSLLIFQEQLINPHFTRLPEKIASWMSVVDEFACISAKCFIVATGSRPCLYSTDIFLSLNTYLNSAARLCMYLETVCYIFKLHYSEESVTRFVKKGRAELKGNVSLQMKMTWMWMQPFLYLTSGKLLKETYMRHNVCGFSFSLPLFQKHYFFYTSMVRC